MKIILLLLICVCRAIKHGQVVKQLLLSRRHGKSVGFRFKEKSDKDCKSSPKSPGCEDHQGWVKYLIIQEGQPLSSNFFFNAKYEQQKFMQSEEMESSDSPEDRLKLVQSYLKEHTDSFGPLDIPSAFSFFAMLSTDFIYLLDSRHQSILHTHDVIDLKLVKKLHNEGEYREGSCFRLVLSEEKNFILCLESYLVKTAWIQFIQENYEQLKPKDKNKEPAGKEEEEDIEVPGFPAPKPEECSKPPETKKRDGVWKTLQDWSQCTVVCGGGTQTYQRICIPPLNGGKECEGEPIQTRPCNEAPCELPAEKPTVLPPKIKLQKTTNRMQRYEPCIINEGDVDVVETQLTQFQVKPRLGGWAVLNNRTLSVFMGEKYDQNAFSCRLDQITEIRDWDEEDPANCFVVQTSVQKSVTLCAMKSSKMDLQEVKQNWLDRLEFFRKKCRQGNVQNRKIPVDKTLEMKKQAIEKLEQQESKEAQEEGSSGGGGSGGNAGTGLMDGIADFQSMAMEAMTKEMKYESMIEAEEKAREKGLDETISTKYEEVCEKEETLKHGLKQTESKKKSKAQQSFDVLQFDDLKQQIKDMIVKKRKAKNDKIALMRKLADMSRQKKQAQLYQKKMEMAGEVMKAQKEGNSTQCTEVAGEQGQCEYCNLYFKDDIQDLQDCKEPSKYCYICCENEFGETHADEREGCFEDCAGLGKGGKGQSGNKGEWVWVPKVNKVAA